MDTSKQFIKMADCPEIQEQWTIPPCEGDFYRLYKDKINIWHKNDEHLNQDSLPMSTWLPRQDQIQAMILTELKKSFKEAGIFLVNNFFWHWLYDPNRRSKLEYVDTLEKLWLAFYLYEKHSKVWSSKEEKWVKK